MGGQELFQISPLVQVEWYLTVCAGDMVSCGPARRRVVHSLMLVLGALVGSSGIDELERWHSVQGGLWSLSPGDWRVLQAETVDDEATLGPNLACRLSASRKGIRQDSANCPHVAGGRHCDARRCRGFQDLPLHNRTGVFSRHSAATAGGDPVARLVVLLATTNARLVSLGVYCYDFLLPSWDFLSLLVSPARA